MLAFLPALQIRLHEANFHVGSLAGRPATHTDLLGVLLNVTEWSVSTVFAANNVSHVYRTITSVDLSLWNMHPRLPIGIIPMQHSKHLHVHCF